MGVTHPTVGYCYEDKNKGEFSSCYESHPHYMWIPLVVLLQAFISYLPHFLWYHWEGESLLVPVLPVKSSLVLFRRKDEVNAGETAGQTKVLQ